MLKLRKAIENLTATVAGLKVIQDAATQLAGDEGATFDNNVKDQWSSDVTIVAPDFEGDLTGDVTGNLTGNVTGDLTGDVTGDVTGNADTATLAEKITYEETTGILISNLTAAIADPSTLEDGSTYLVKNTVDSKIYTVFVEDGKFLLSEPYGLTT